MQLKFSLRAIFALIAVVAVVCTVLFAVPEYIRLSILFVGVVAMPGPLATSAWFGSRESRAFGLGGLVAYVAWLAIAGIPVAILAANELSNLIGVTLSQFGTSIGRFPGGVIPGVARVPPYMVYAGLYLPWISVPCAGLLSMLSDVFFRKRTDSDAIA